MRDATPVRRMGDGGSCASGSPVASDQSAGDEVRAAIERLLAGHVVDAATIQRVRTQRSGKRLFVDIAMGFDGTASIAEVDRQIEAIKSAVRHELADADFQTSPR